MKSSDLMLDDWILHNNKPKKVDVIWGKEVSLDDPTQVWGSIYTDKFNEEEIEPIPLTPEILEKNGFIGDKNVCKTKMRDDSKDELWQCEYAWYLKNLRIKNCTNGSVARLYNIMFVHELQHALRLCGINKEITV